MTRRKQILLLASLSLVSLVTIHSVSARKPLLKTPMARRQAPVASAVHIYDAHTTQFGSLVVTGDANGLVTLTDTQTGTVERTWQMDAGVPARQVFLLDNGQTVGAAQKDHTIFWNVASGEETGRIEAEAYGFSHDQSKFFVYDNSQNQQEIALYSYPTLQPLASLATQASGPDSWVFSPDDHYLAIYMATSNPYSDESYPHPDAVDRNLCYAQMFDLTTNTEVQIGSFLPVRVPIGFSADSRFYLFSGAKLVSAQEGSLQGGTFQLDIDNRAVCQSELKEYLHSDRMRL